MERESHVQSWEEDPTHVYQEQLEGNVQFVSYISD